MATLDPRVKIYKNGTWQTPDVPKRYTGGSWQELQSMKAYFNRQWNELIQSGPTPTTAYYPLYAYMHLGAVSATIPGRAYQNMVSENDDGSITIINDIIPQSSAEEVISRVSYPDSPNENVWQYYAYYQNMGCTHRTCFVFCPSTLDDITITNTGTQDAGVGVVYRGELTKYDIYDGYAYDARNVTAGNSLTLTIEDDPTDYRILIFVDNAYSGNSVKISIAGKKILCPIRYARKGNNALYNIDGNGTYTLCFSTDGSFYSFAMETSPNNYDSIIEHYGEAVSMFGQGWPFCTILARDPSRYKLVAYCNDQYNGYQIYYPDSPVYYDNNLSINYNNPQRYAAATSQILESKTRDASGYTVETIGFVILRKLSSLEKCYFKLYDNITGQYIPDSLFNVLQSDTFN